MALHTKITDETGLPIYFCDPHSPWQRGTNENTNGLLRQYFPKGTDLSFYGPGLLDQVAAELNARPRKRLGFETPAEALQRLLSQPPNLLHRQPESKGGFRPCKPNSRQTSPWPPNGRGAFPAPSPRVWSRSHRREGCRWSARARGGLFHVRSLYEVDAYRLRRISVRVFPHGAGRSGSCTSPTST